MTTDDVRKSHTNRVSRDVFPLESHIHSQQCDQLFLYVRLSLLLKPFPHLLVVQHTPSTSVVQVQMLATTVCSSTTAYNGTSDELQMLS
jgi:hypothetical protein